MVRWFTRVRVALRSILRRRHEDLELNEELDFHLQREIEERERAGLPRIEARRAALRTMGGIERSKEECRELRSGHGLAVAAGRFFQDARFALRLFRKHPAPIGIVIGGLGVAIGIVTAVFSIINASLLRPYGMEDPSTVVSVARPNTPAWVGWPFAQFRQMQSGATTVELEAAISDRVRFSSSAAGDGLDEEPIYLVSGGYLRLLGARAVIGRSLEPADALPGAPATIVISHRFWQTELGGRPTVIGQTVWVSNVPMMVIGVLEPGFTGPVEVQRSIWTTFASFDDLGIGPAITATTGPRVEVIGRLRPGFTRQVAQENLTAVLSAAGEAAADSGHGGPGVRVHSAASPISGPMESDTMLVLTLITCLVGLVLTQACVNAANLLMASAVTRTREVGVRLALGASAGRLTMQMVNEGVVLGLIAGVLGFALASWLVPVFGVIGDLPPGIDLAPDGRVLAFAVLVSLVCGLGAGLAPARHGARRNVLATFQSQGGPRGGAGMRSLFRSSFVGLQAAVSMLLLVMAGLLTRSALEMTRVDIGFDAGRLVAVSLHVPRGEIDEAVYVEAAVNAVRRLPSVERASVSQTQPFGGSVEHDRFIHDGRSMELNITRSDAEFFATTGVRIVRGRSFMPDEVRNDAPVTVISENVARTFFGHADPIGRFLSLVPSETGGPQPHATIVGVAAEALLTRVDGQTFGEIYHPISRERSNPPSLLVRTTTPGRTAREVEAALRGVDPRVRPTTSLVQRGLDDYLGFRRRMVWVLGPPAVLALLLAALGVYGMMAFVVSLRTSEISVRMALGASAADVLRLLVRDGMRPVVVGLAVGLGFGLAAGRVFAQELPGISPSDPTAVGAALAILLTFALLAVVVPAVRAARMDPAVVLREG